ncbi:hypothetical protein AWC38_SpisGene234 [Stylophora pistillata]|uniref:Uncharacterized protein n=2 Tax=Stylophora pistillata TaxID=50429 RepID=A0A2B4T2H7_STYPI|nr:hypothetical protein AWC38_SpisGene234 [Stylophora pistillata]
MDPGFYKLDITLDYSLCDGYRDPPKNWFIVGNSQGKMQKDGTLGVNRAKDDYLLQVFQNGKLIMINIPLPEDRGAFLINQLPDRPCLSAKFNLSCGMDCKFMWDGFGRWLGTKWKPYLTGVKRHRKPMKSSITAPKLEKLWIYGDSQAERLHLSIKDGPLCKEIFKSCNLSKMWVYPYSGQFPKWDDEDFDESIILDSLRSVVERLDMSQNNVLILNLGLHYMESIKLQDYRILLLKVIDLLNERNKDTGELKHKARVIWKTSTSISKEKDTGSQLTSDRRRFLALPRVALYNSFATSLMCQAGLEVLDVYPFTRSYPGGTGGPEVAWYKERDIVHFKFRVMKPVEQFLEDYFLGKIAFPLNFENYVFS